MRPDLKPKSFVRVLDQAFELYRANFKTIALGTALVLFPLALLMSLAQVFYYRGALELAAEIFTQASQGGADVLTSPEDFLGLTMSSVVVQAIGPVYWAARVYIATCLFAAGPRMLAGERVTLRDFMRPGFARVFWVGLIWVVGAIVINIGAVFLIVPGIIAAISLSVADVVSVVEQVSLPTAMSRSWALTKGSWLRIIVFAMFLALLLLLLQVAISSPALIRQFILSISDPMALVRPASPLWMTVDGVFAALAIALVFPFAELARMSLYLDLRARREGMDLVARATDIAGDER